MALFIANATRQKVHIHCRLPENKRITMIEIRSGEQWQSGTELTQSQISAIVAHLDLFGGRPLSSFSGKELKGFSGLIYADRPIKTDSILAANEVVMDQAQDRSVATATANALAQDLILNGADGERRIAKTTSIEVVEEPMKGETRRGKKRVNMSLEVTPQGRDNNKLAV